MKKDYTRNITLRCITCGHADLEISKNGDYAKCINCNREYLRGYDELLELNQDLINHAQKSIQDEVIKDAEIKLKNMFRKALKGSKNIKLK